MRIQANLCPQPRHAHTARASIQCALVVAKILDNVEQTLRMAYPKRLNASTYRTALTRTIHLS